MIPATRATVILAAAATLLVLTACDTENGHYDMTNTDIFGNLTTGKNLIKNGQFTEPAPDNDRLPAHWEVVTLDDNTSAPHEIRYGLEITDNDRPRTPGRLMRFAAYHSEIFQTLTSQNLEQLRGRNALVRMRLRADSDTSATARVMLHLLDETPDTRTVWNIAHPVDEDTTAPTDTTAVPYTNEWTTVQNTFPVSPATNKLTLFICLDSNDPATSDTTPLLVGDVAIYRAR